jgi:AbrB family looped-hinge helix DNA binding protein
MITSKLTSRGRVTIPKEIREYLGLNPGDRVRFVLKDGKLVMQLAKLTLQDLRGAVEPGQQPEDFGAVRSKVRKKVASRTAKGPELGSRDG